MKRFLTSGFILSYIAIFIQSIISIAYTPVMLRLMGQSDYGLLQLAISTVANLGFLSFGFGSSYLRFYSHFHAENDRDAISVLNGMFMIVFCFASLISLIAGSIISLNAQAIFSHSLTPDEISSIKILLAVMTVNLALSFPCTVFDSYIISQEKFSFQKILLIITSLLNPLLTFPLLLIGKGSLSVAICMSFITLIKLIAGAVFCIKRLGMKFRFTVDKSLLRELLVFSFFVFLNIISDQINWNVDKTLLGIFRGSNSVTKYSLGSQFNGYFLTFSYVLTSLFSPRAYRKVAAKKSNESITRFFAFFGRLQLVILAYFFLIFFALGKPFLRMWSGIDSDIPYYTALLLISPLLVTAIQEVGIEIQRAKDMYRFRSVIYILIALGNILLSIPLCIKFGELGCAAATCLCITAGNIIIMNIYYHKKVGLNMFYFWKEILKLIPSLIIPTAAAVLVKYYIKTELFSVIISAVILTIIYVPCVFLLGLNKFEKKIIKKVL